MKNNLFEGGLLVIAVLFAFLGNLRAAMIVAVAIPLSMLFAFAGSACAPFVQPGAPTSPSAFDQPPEYQAQSTPAALSRSPMVGAVCGGSRLASAVPGAYGW